MLKSGIILLASYMAISTGSALANCSAKNGAGKTCNCYSVNCPGGTQCSCADASGANDPVCQCRSGNTRLYTPIRDFHYTGLPEKASIGER
jgi:hypothetical protein